jgi:hypothetical protein
VLDECEEHIRGYCFLFVLPLVMCFTDSVPLDPDDHTKLTKETRSLGLVVCRGTALILISPLDGSEQISNPFIQHME